MLLRHFLALAGILALAACGNTTGDRALSGGAIGAGTGAGVGAATSPRDVNLGRPVWR